MSELTNTEREELAQLRKQKATREAQDKKGISFKVSEEGWRLRLWTRTPSRHAVPGAMASTFLSNTSIFRLDKILHGRLR